MLARLQKLKNKKGFTLVELIVVIAIIAILAAVLIPVIGNYVADANASANEQTMKEIENAISIEISEMGNAGAKLNSAGTLTIVAGGGVTNSSVTVAAASTTFPNSYGDASKFTSNIKTRLTNLQMPTGVTSYTVTIGKLGSDFVVTGVTANGASNNNNNNNNNNG